MSWMHPQSIIKGCLTNNSHPGCKTCDNRFHSGNTRLDAKVNIALISGTIYPIEGMKAITPFCGIQKMGSKPREIARMEYKIVRGCLDSKETPLCYRCPEQMSGSRWRFEDKVRSERNVGFVPIGNPSIIGQCAFIAMLRRR